MSKPYLVFGGTGHYGQYIVRSLISKDLPVRIFTRNAHKASDIFTDLTPSIPIEYLEGDVLDGSSLRKAIEGSAGIIVTLSAMHSKLIHKQWAIEHDAVIEIIRLAEELEVNRFIFISVYDLDPDFIEKINLEVGRLKMSVEEKIKESRLNWTIMGAPPSMQLMHAMRRGSRLIALGGGPPALPTIAPQDMGEVVAQATIRDDLGGKRFRVLSPEKISHRIAAEIWSEYLGTAVKYQKVPLVPLNLVSLITYPFNPYLRHLYSFVKLLNQYPQYLVDEIEADYAKLSDTFSYTPTSFREFLESLG